MTDLNLLNPNERNKAKKIKLYFIVKFLSIQLLIVTAIISAVSYFSVALLQNDLDSIEQQIESEILFRESGELNSIEDATEELNSQLQQVESIQAKYLVWTQFINDIALLIPENITIDRAEFNTNLLLASTINDFEIEGTALTREDFIAFQQILNDSSIFSEIDAPISNLIQKENINFTISGILTP